MQTYHAIFRQLSVIGAIVLAVLYSFQIIFPWIQSHTLLTRPFVTLAACIFFTLLPVGVDRLTFARFMRSLQWVDIGIALFFGYAFLRLSSDDLQIYSRSFAGISSTAIAYVLARVIGAWQPRAFLLALIIVGTFILTFTGPELYRQSWYASYAERVIIFQEILATQWPSVLFGTLAVIFIALSLQTKTWKIAIVCGIYAALLWCFPMLAGARGVVVAMSLCALFMVCKFHALPWRRWATLALILMAAIFSVSQLSPQRIAFFLQFTTAPLDPSSVVPQGDGRCIIRDNSLLARSVLYRDALRTFLDRPLLGTGTGAFIHHTCVYGSTAVMSDPHSSVLHVAAELGIVGLVLFLSVIVWIFRQDIPRLRLTRHVPWITQPLFAAWLFQLIYDQFSGNYLSGIHFFLLSGLLVGVLSTKKPKAEQR